ncbi:MAG: DUF1444 family protein [Sporolactobacillus sp.]
MTLQELARALAARLEQSGWHAAFDPKKEKMKIKDDVSGHEVTLVLSELLRKYPNDYDQAIAASVHTIAEAFAAMRQKQELAGHKESIYPVIRPASFPEQLKDGRRLLVCPHTAETNIFFVLDLGGSYRLLDRRTVQDAGLSLNDIQNAAYANINKLPVHSTIDVVRNNRFYFINYNDGYDASRLLNRRLMQAMRSKAEGELVCAIPHQDVLIFADIVNPEGYDVLAQMVLKFYAAADAPISLLPFLCHADSLEPLFIMAQRRPRPLGPER